MATLIDKPHTPAEPLGVAASAAQSLRVLMLIPSEVKRGIEAEVAAGMHPRMDYHELERALGEQGCSVDVRDYTSLKANPCSSMAMKDLRLAALGYAMRKRYDVIFCNSESIALPLGAMLRVGGRRAGRPRVVAIGHRVTPSKKRVFFTRLRAMEAIDTLFLYAETQRRFAVETLGCPKEKAPLISFHADELFFTPAAGNAQISSGRSMVCSAGLEWRDYPTLIEVARRMPEVDFNLAAASPWSKHVNETERAALPANVTARRYSYAELRELYRSSDCVALPLYDNDFQAGVTTLLEAMACGKAVVVTRTEGQRDVVQDGANGFYVAPGDVDAMETALRKMLSDNALRERVGQSARIWTEEHASLGLWAQTVAAAVLDAAKRVSKK